MRLVSCLLICIFSNGIFGQLSMPDSGLSTLSEVSNTEKVIIDYVSLFREVSRKEARNNKIIITLPVHGREQQFSLTENQVIDEAFRQIQSDIYTFDLEGIDDPQYRGSATISPRGIFALILKDGKMISIYPENLNLTNFHYVEYGIRPDFQKYKSFCGHDHTLDGRSRPLFTPSRSGIMIGDVKKSYLVAIVTTGEYYVANGNNDAAVRNKVVADVNSISAIFKNELSVSLNVGSRISLNRDPATDPFSPGTDRTLQAANAVAAAFPNQTSYHIGHVFHRHQDGDGWENGGVARLGSVCNNFDFGTGKLKGGGWSGAYENNSNGWISLATHEFAHQFNAQHTFNGIGEACTAAISQNNAYEIASGTTIMSYNGICQADNNIPSSDVLDNYFHYASLLEMYNYITAGIGNSCGGESASTNNIPVVSANPCNAPQVTIPKGTPFYVKASGSDADNDMITYCWEQFDEDGIGTATQGFTGNQAGNSTVAPLFRSYPPNMAPDRYFPSLAILRGVTGTSDFEVLPNTMRNITLNVTARDNNAAGGAASTDLLDINVSANGPFLVDFPNGGEVITAGTPITIKWKINNTAALCDKVRILLSVDGGLTYNKTIAENVSYDGGLINFSFPATFAATTAARIMIECMDFECIRFFNVSRTNFTINSSCLAEENFICPDTPLTAEEGSAALELKMTAINGSPVSTLSGTITNQSSLIKIAVLNETGPGCISLAALPNGFPAATGRFVVEKSGTYRFQVSGGFVSVFRAASFNPNNPCPTFVGSSGRWLGPIGNGTSVNQFSALSVDLSACTEYVIVFYSYSPLPTTATISDISGPGKFIALKSNPSNNYSLTHIAVDQATGKVAYVSQNADLRNAAAGVYRIYSISYKSSGAEPPANINPVNWIGKLLSEIELQECVYVSAQSRLITITASCKIISVTTGTQTPCVPGTNTYTQELIVTYNKPPQTGKLVVNGQEFDITGSPQSVILTGLDSDGAQVNVTTLFSDFQSCSLTLTNLFKAPVNCCPITLDLGTDQRKCKGEKITLSAGNDGQSYKWTRDGIALTNTTSTLEADMSGNYVVEVTHSSGCKKTDAVTLTFVDPPSITMQTNVDLCIGATFTITAVITGQFSTATWFKNNTVIPGITQPVLEITEAGTYKLLITNADGCSSEKTVVVNQVSPPAVNLGADRNVCQGNPVILSAGNEGVKYTWFFNGNAISGATGATYTVPDGQSGVYNVIVENSGACTNADEVRITFFQSPVVSMPLQIKVCQGETATISVTASGYDNFIWKLNGVVFNPTNGLTHNTTTSGVYFFEASNAGGCTTIKSTDVQVNPNPSVELGNNKVACIGADVKLDAGTGGTTYKWTRNGAALAENNAIITVTQSGVYAVTVTNNFNCSSTDMITVTFEPGPSVSLGPDVKICEGQSATITATTDATAIVWKKDGEVISGATGKTLMVSTQGTYTIEVTGGPSNCTVTDQIQVTVFPVPVVNIGSDKSICEGESITLDAGNPGSTYVWTLNNNQYATSKTILSNLPGTYKVVVTNSFNCSASDDMFLTVNPLPALDVPTTLDLCAGTEKTITPTTNGTVFQWFKDGIAISGATLKDLKISQAGSYKIQVKTAAGCSREATIVVTSRQAPSLELGNDKNLCPNEKITLDAGNHEAYNWSTGASSRTVEINAGTPAVFTVQTISVTVTNTFGCTSSDNIKINISPVVTAKVTSDAPGVCNGAPVTLTASGGLYYSWTDPGNTLSVKDKAVTIATPNTTTTYIVEVSDDCPGNKASASVEIKVFTAVNVSAGRDTSVVIGRSIKLKATGGVSYIWDNQSLIVGNPNTATPEVKPTETTTFSVTVTDINGCDYVDSVVVTVIQDPLSNFKEVTIITPNGDGDNDALEFIGLESFPDNSLKIYNRWGGLIFEAYRYQSFGPLFDGTKNGERLPADTYYYVLIFEDKVIKNALTVIWD